MLLLDYLKLSLGKLNDTLNYSFSGSTPADFTIVLEDSITAYDPTYTDESQCSDTIKLRKIGKVVMWKKILADISTAINFSADNASFSNEQLYNHILKQYQLCYCDSDFYAVGVQNFSISGSTVSDEFSYD